MNAARQFIEAIASNMAELKKPLKAICDTLEDGEALEYLGATDEDQEMIEEAHDMVSAWISAGIKTFDEVGEVATLDGKHYHRIDVITNYMDDDLREELHSNFASAGTSAQQFVDAYVKAHAAKFDGEEFEIS
jgi:hypothetical protein